MNLGELERKLIDAARCELGPSAADRERNEAELFERLGGAASAPLGGPHSVGASGVLRRSALSRVGLAVQSSRGAVLGLGLVVGAAVGGWLGFGLGQSGWLAARERAPAADMASPEPGTSSDRLAPAAVDPGTQGEPLRVSEAAPGEASGAGEPAGQGVVTDATGDVLASELLASPRLDADGSPGAGSGAKGAHATARRSVTGSERSSLAAELAMLQRARRALNAANGRLALGIVQELDEQFPRGILMEERNATRVLGLCQLGQVDEARRVAHSFIERYPGSVYAERVRRACVVDLQE